MQEIPSWFASNYIEILGTISSLIYLYLSIKKNILCWLFGIIASGLYVYIFLLSGFYADMGLNVYYVFISIYGWINWSKTNKQEVEIKTGFVVSRLDRKLSIILFFVFLIIFIGIVIILVNYTDSQIPYWDAFTTAGSIIATWMLARKILEHWILWIIVDFVSLGLYIYKDLYATSLLFLIYTIMAVVGFISWKKNLK